MNRRAIEDAVKKCYSTWDKTYFRDYYRGDKNYPPVHRRLVTDLLRNAGARTVLDAGCGPASILREVVRFGIDPYGFDLTPSMAAEAKRILVRRGVPEEHIWEGSVLRSESFKYPAARRLKFDAAVCIGVFPHIPQAGDIQVLRNLRDSVKKDGLVIVEARNELFALFTMNRYSYEFLMHRLIGKNANAEISKELKKYFRIDLPPIRRGGKNQPGYDEILSRTHNPFQLRQQFLDAGLKDVQTLFYHFHCLPPMFESKYPALFRKESWAMEDPADWRGHFMASAFLMTGRR